MADHFSLLLMFCYFLFLLGEPPVAHQGMMSRSSSNSPAIQQSTQVAAAKSAKVTKSRLSLSASAATAARRARMPSAHSQASRVAVMAAVFLLVAGLLPHLASSAPTPQDDGKYTPGNQLDMLLSFIQHFTHIAAKEMLIEIGRQRGRRRPPSLNVISRFFFPLSLKYSTAHQPISTLASIFVMQSLFILLQQRFEARHLGRYRMS